MTAMRPEEFHRCFSGRNRADLNAQIVFNFDQFCRRSERGDTWNKLKPFARRVKRGGSWKV